MNTILLLMYLADLSGKMEPLLLGSLCILLAGIMLWFGGVQFNDDTSARMVKAARCIIKISIAVVIFAFLYPSKNTLYIAASAKVGQIGIEKLQGSDTLEKALKLLDKKLDEALAEEKK
ncbi:hypothetical protein [uncultured Campylobacter sp.]|uniref:hypothetical protein n=1 Tax=uncultured Campylobacter sp. TaxID=218934 RepID=UPI00262AFBD0|nr:hypothetical protein [uncultured Campylobacter sp.]